MRAIEARRFEMFVRVCQFGETHKTLFRESTAGRQAFDTVAAAVAELEEHAHSKMSAAGTRRMKTRARLALIGRLEAIARTARVIIDGSTGLHGTFRVPTRLMDLDILAAGRAFIQNGEPLASQFVAHGLPATFLADLRQLIERFEQAIDSHYAGRSARTMANTGTDAAFAAGFNAVRTLDVVVANFFAGDPVTMATWQRSRRVGYPRRARNAAKATAGPQRASHLRLQQQRMISDSGGAKASAA